MSNPNEKCCCGFPLAAHTCPGQAEHAFVGNVIRRAATALAAANAEIQRLEAEVERANVRSLGTANFIGEVLPLHVQFRGPIDALRWFREETKRLTTQRDEARAALTEMAEAARSTLNIGEDTRKLFEDYPTGTVNAEDAHSEFAKDCTKRIGKLTDLAAAALALSPPADTAAGAKPEGKE